VTPVRVHPFDLIFAPFRDERFPAIRGATGERPGLDAFLLAAPALELMQELRPEAGLGDAVDDFVALVHAAYRFWCDGEGTISFDAAATRSLCAPAAAAVGPDARAGTGGPRPTQYIQVAPRIVWGMLTEDGPFEPLDGWFDVDVEGGMRMVACFGVHSDRPGVSVVAVDGDRPDIRQRDDGSSLFVPRMEGGSVAGLHSVDGPDELLLLGWNARGREGER
jgi:hypothetical protein